MTNAEWTGSNSFNYCLNQSILFGFVFAPVFEVIIKKDQGAVGRVKGFDKKKYDDYGKQSRRHSTR